MSDDDFGGLIPYYEEFVPKYLPKSNGQPRSRRSAQAIADRYNLPLVRIALCAYIDPALAAERLKEAQIRDRAEPRRGRPRTLAR